MATTFVLRVWTRFFDSPARVWEEKTSPAGVAREFPFWAPFSVADEEGLRAALASGRPFETTASLGPVPWPLSVERVEPGVAFVDRSTNALFHTWRHEHRVEPTTDGARYIDTVTFAPALRASKLQAIATERFFVRRHRAAAQALSADTRTIGVSALRVANDEDVR